MNPQNANRAATPAMQQALNFLSAGKTVEAEETVLRAAEETRRKFGAHSVQDAIAQNELGSILLNVGQLDRAIDAFTESVGGPAPTDEQAMRDRLTFLMNLGQTLQIAKRLDEAEEALHKGLEGREGFYGREHSGYAFGLEPLAEVTFALGKSKVALAMMDEVVRNFWRNGHARVAGAIAIRAAMLKSAEPSRAPFAGLDKLPDDIIIETARQAVSRVARSDDLKNSRLVLSDLAELLAHRLGESHEQTIGTSIAISNIERKLGREGNAGVRQSTIQRLILIFDKRGRARDGLQSTLALALAFSDAGENDKAIETYEQAVERATKLDDATEKSHVLRNFGLLLVELKRDADAEARLRHAIAEGTRGGDLETAARAMVALGVFLQHVGRLQEAKPMLADALPMLDLADPDALTGRSHLQAIENHGSCGCGDTSAVIADAFRAYVMERAPAGLLKRLDVTMKDGDFSLDVHLDRKPSDDELQHLQRVTEHALTEFRRKIAKEN